MLILPAGESMASPSTAPIKHPALAALDAAPLDDEPASPLEELEVALAREEARQGETVAHVEVRRRWLDRA